MVFITKNNANIIYHAVDKEKLDKIYTEDLYNVSLWMFSLREARWLAAAKMFFQSTEFFIDNFFKKIETEKKSDWVFENTTPAFHYYENCNNLASDYFNLKIPVEIVGRGETEKRKFREWFKENNTLLEENPNKFLTRLEASFMLRNRPKIEEFRADNSGMEDAENMNIEALKNRIDISILEMKSIHTKHDIIHKYGKRTHIILNKTVVLENKEDELVILDWHKLKNDLKKNLKIYFMLRFNPDLEFKESVLETIGFKECHTCTAKKALLGD